MSSLHVTQFQAGSGEGTLVLLHGFPVDSRMWAPMSAEIDPGWQVLGVDLPGLGGSFDTLPESPSIAVAAELVRESVAPYIAEIAPVVYGGLSMGGYVLFEVLQRFHKDIAGAIFLDTRVNADDQETAAKRLKIADDALASGNAEVVLGMASGTLSESNVHARPELVEFMKSLIETQTGEGIAWSQRAMASRRDGSATLGSFAKPSLVIVGADDHVSSPQVMRSLAQELSDVRFTEIPDAGHMSPVEQPGRVAGVINEFLDQVLAITRT